MVKYSEILLKERTKKGNKFKRELDFFSRGLKGYQRKKKQEVGDSECKAWTPLLEPSPPVASSLTQPTYL